VRKCSRLPHQTKFRAELGRHIVTTGRRVYCHDAEADHAFVRDVQLRAADLEPFLRRARRIKLDALAPNSLANPEGDER